MLRSVIALSTVLFTSLAHGELMKSICELDHLGVTPVEKCYSAFSYGSKLGGEYHSIKFGCGIKSVFIPGFNHLNDKLKKDPEMLRQMLRNFGVEYDFAGNEDQSRWIHIEDLKALINALDVVTMLKLEMPSCLVNTVMIPDSEEATAIFIAIAIADASRQEISKALDELNKNNQLK